jgi:hypothetical protein
MNLVLNTGWTLWRGKSPLDLPTDKYLYIASSVADEPPTTKAL